MKSEDRIYFKGLDGLRAIGAFTVLIGHIELSKQSLGIDHNLLEIPYFKYTSGHLGVILFYVLSGFLITYLLLKEKAKNGAILIKEFYFRRALKIWPIYYLTIILLFFFLPHFISLDYYGKPNLNDLPGLLSTILIYFFIVPNLVSFGINGLGAGFHLGSIGIEEQFYILWPWLIKWFNNILTPIVLILILIPLIPHICDYSSLHIFQSNSKALLFIKQLGEFFNYFKINCMALGGLFAWLFYKNATSILNIIYKKSIQFIALLIGLGGWIMGLHIPMFTDEFYAFFFAIIILNTATNPNKIVSFDYKTMNYLGKISYGIYVYHWAIIYIVMNLIIPYKHTNIFFNIVLYTCSIGLTIVIAHLSYFYFELWFLKLKERFSEIKSNALYSK